VTAAVEESVASAVEDSVAADIEGSVEASVEVSVEADVEQRVMIAVEERLELEIVDAIESELEDDESRILKEQWLVMAEPTVFAELQVKGYLFDTVTELPALGLRLAEVAAPSTFDITDVRNGVLDVVGKDRAEVDLNHFYTAGAPVSSSVAGVDPRAAMLLPTDLDDLDVRVGMIDSRVDMSHPALAASRIETRSFARPGAEAPDFHGTAIASIIAANSAEFRGLAPNAELYAASVFELDRKRGEVASTVSLIRALDWLLSTKVDVINISLAGPPNRLLEKALQRAADNRVVVMAAAGNGGPVARPMYPAAYDSVVAVTAVDATQQVFRLANRGDYLALAAPGVDLRHARAGGGYAASSGTSFAVPFAVTAAARLSRLRPQDDIITLLLESALDLGPPGRDTIYGYGLLTLSSL
jgi:subtilisin family serine protease